MGANQSTKGMTPAQKQEFKDLKKLDPGFHPDDGTLINCSQLGLNNKNLRTIPPGVSLLTNLNALWLEHNQLLTLTTTITTLTKLTMLRAYGNKFSVVPNEISHLTNLKQLYLNINSISSFPAWFSSLENLNHLSAESNNLSVLPSEVSVLTKLTYLNIHSNPMEDLPDWVVMFKQLKVLLVENAGKVNIKSIPRDISTLPCWRNKEKHSGIVIADSLQKIAPRDMRETIEQLEAKYSLSLRISVSGAQSLFNSARSYTPSGAPASFADRFPDNGENDEPVEGEYADVMFAEFTEANKLGEGGFGDAYKVQLQKGVVAVKVLKKETKPKTPEYDELTREARLMISLKHVNIIGLYGYGCRNKKVIYVMEYADGKSIDDMIKADGPLPFDKLMLFTIQINAGLEYLHSRSPPVEHRDLKPENVLLCGGVAKICDFGLSTARETVSRATQFAGTYHYVTPESFDMKAYGPMSDMYTFGLVIWSMLTGKRPYDGMTLPQIMAQKTKKKIPEIPATCPVKLAQVMKDCWEFDPRQRPTAADLAPRLEDIQKDPGKLLGEQPKSVEEMSTGDLVAFLTEKRIYPSFVASIKENEVTGADFLTFTEEVLIAEPFKLSKFQAKVVLKAIEDAKGGAVEEAAE